MTNEIGALLREQRQKLLEADRKFTLRQVALRIGLEPSYLSKVERGETIRLSEKRLAALADDLGLDPDIVLALSGKVSKDVQDIIRKRPGLFAQLIRELEDVPDNAVLRIVREVKDGEW
jgi:transcriptional regulator with XRE-family HTH domain